MQSQIVSYIALAIALFWNYFLPRQVKGSFFNERSLLCIPLFRLTVLAFIIGTAICGAFIVLSLFGGKSVISAVVSFAILIALGGYPFFNENIFNDRRKTTSTGFE